ncbi:MAG: alpha/beta hydrolase, partial [Alphaproteobacteria bacterium]|nr:alpha/beta hydrolase [Alphaproteobacteria bacterium]
MTTDDERLFDINTGTYDWCVRSFQAIRKRLGLNIKVYDDEKRIQQGHIFLFNHFARFETIIPPFVIHRTTGNYCRSVADHHLFAGGEKFAKLLRGVGAVPNNLPGLLPFLAAEILRGRKVVVFPEGGMVKDRRVLDDRGGYSVYSRKSHERRRHHRGAAVLAMTLDMFKRRILELHDQDDTKRIGRWVRSLGLKDPAELLARAVEPTIIVPATITFYPIHIEDNIVSRAADFLFREMPKNLVEEMKIEGNFLLRETDMDIRVGRPIQAGKKWSWWEKIILNRYFTMSVQSLDDLFGLKDQPEGLAERMLARCVHDESNKIRDTYMRAMYEGITVNLSHL